MLEQIVTSKYFQKSGMDDSLTDFKEKKNICTGPKTIKKSKVKKQNPKKRIKGQKDIRTLIKLKNNELLAFTKDFNNVCEQGGIDVDSQQLQLAIALSKSLQQSQQVEAENFPNSKNLSSQERTNRIRRTLQEYGFRIPEAKIRLDAYKRVKKYRKPYKLLQISEEERQQNICNRYSQILFENPDKSFDKDVRDCNTSSKLYNLATNTTYNYLKNNEVFYLSEILKEISPCKGNLLRDWSDIPGRPVSPKLVEEFVISMSDIQCSQTDLDIILSGTLNSSKNILKSRLNNSYCDTKIQVKVSNFNIPEVNIASVQNTPIDSFNQSILINKGLNEMSIMSLPQQNRSNSPDIFDDEPSLIDHSINNTHQNVKNTTKSKAVSDNITFLDLTVQTELTNNVNTLDPCSQPSCNITKRKSNDFMDLTECVPVTSHRETKLLSPLEKIDKVQLIYNDCMEFTCVNPISQKNKDLMQNNKIKGDITNDSLKSNEDVSLELKHATKSHDLSTVKAAKEDGRILEECSSDDTIILNDDYIDLTQDCDNNSKVGDSLKTEGNMETLDLTQSSSSDHELPAVYIPGTQKFSLDDTIIINNGENDAVLTEIKTNKVTILPKSNKQEINTDFQKEGNVNTGKVNEDTILDISDDILPSNHNFHVQNISNDLHNKTQFEYQEANQSFNSENIADMENDNIDLTQSSNSTIEDYQGYSDNGFIHENLQFNDYNSLGKKDDVSIDYDEIAREKVEYASLANEQCQDFQSKSSNISKSSLDSIKSKNDIAANCSNISESFILSDKELNYSLCKSKVDNIDFEDISNEDDIPNSPTSHNRTHTDNYTINRSLSESDLPTVSVNDNNTNYRTKHFDITLSKSACSTPIKAIVSNDKVSIKTPTNSEYVVKFGEVTPMLDYAAMSTPERNRELEKYGLKPFKRKRAIQLLTHLYNQTHPIVEQCSQDPVQLKKFKPNFTNKSPENNKSPKKTNTELDKENNIYRETKNIPDIKDIQCGADDWVFQKREKAKVQSCPVPLHIALHNYVSCRRRLREAILRYEPINIDVIHKDLVSYGYKYNPKDLLKFLDRKCITVKTADNARNNK